MQDIIGFIFFIIIILILFLLFEFITNFIGGLISLPRLKKQANLSTTDALIRILKCSINPFKHLYTDDEITKIYLRKMKNKKKA